MEVKPRVNGLMHLESNIDDWYQELMHNYIENNTKENDCFNFWEENNSNDKANIVNVHVLE